MNKQILVKRMMQEAKELQLKHARANSKNTQNVRNHIPVWQILLGYIPTIRYSGKVKLKKQTLPTANEIISNASQDDWLVNPRTYKSVLHSMLKKGFINAITLKHCRPEGRGRSPLFYFQIAK